MIFTSFYAVPAFSQDGRAPRNIIAEPFDECSALPEGQSITPRDYRFANIQPASGSNQNSKSAAILGSARSKLEEMRDTQALAKQDANNGVSRFTLGLVLQLPKHLECGGVDLNESLMPTVSASPPTRDMILGTFSVAIKHSPFDRGWAAVTTKRVSRKAYRTLAATGARKSGDESAQVEAVNRWVNRNIAFGEDRDVYGQADYWAPAAETLRRRIGDCEDFAIAKMYLLTALGISHDKMRLVVARDLVRNADHAVLVVTTANGVVMLDNMTDQLLDARLPNDYRPIMSFSQNAKWVHGYAAQNARPVRMALANPVSQSAASHLAEVQTVTAEPEMPALSMALLSVPLVLPSGLSVPA